jgi:pimeloyl-ACP methyl ester carboxylesterase
LSIRPGSVRRVVKETKKGREMSTVTSKDGARIAYTATGKGPAIILVSGATSYPALDPTLPVLTDLIKDDFTFVTYDRRGRGESGDTKPFSVDREIEDIEALINAFSGRAGLYGQSSGAVLSLQAAGKLSGITHVLAYEPPYAMPGAGYQVPADYVATLERFNEAGDRSSAAAYFMQTVGMSDAEIEGMKQSPFWPVMEAVAPTIVYDAYAMTRDRKGSEIPSHLWARSRARILVVDGGASFPGMPEAADAVARATPGARRKTLGGQGHGASPESIAPVIKAFFAG